MAQQLSQCDLTQYQHLSKTQKEIYLLSRIEESNLLTNIGSFEAATELLKHISDQQDLVLDPDIKASDLALFWNARARNEECLNRWEKARAVFLQSRRFVTDEKEISLLNEYIASFEERWENVASRDIENLLSAPQNSCLNPYKDEVDTSFLNLNNPFSSSSILNLSSKSVILAQEKNLKMSNNVTENGCGQRINRLSEQTPSKEPSPSPKDTVERHSPKDTGERHAPSNESVEDFEPAMLSSPMPHRCPKAAPSTMERYLGFGGDSDGLDSDSDIETSKSTLVQPPLVRVPISTETMFSPKSSVKTGIINSAMKSGAKRIKVTPSEVPIQLVSQTPQTRQAVLETALDIPTGIHRSNKAIGSAKRVALR